MLTGYQRQLENKAVSENEEWIIPLEELELSFFSVRFRRDFARLSANDIIKFCYVVIGKYLLMCITVYLKLLEPRYM